MTFKFLKELGKACIICDFYIFRTGQ